MGTRKRLPHEQRVTGEDRTSNADGLPAPDDVEGHGVGQPPHDLVGQVFRMSDRAELWATRLAVLVLGAIPVFLALKQFDLVQFVVLLQASLVASFFFATVVIGINWKGATASGAIASMIVGFGAALGWYFAGEPLGLDPVVPGVTTSLVTFWLVSRLTAVPSRENLALFFPEERRVTRPAQASPET